MKDKLIGKEISNRIVLSYQIAFAGKNNLPVLISTLAMLPNDIF
jgi:hypothetical protein